MHADGKNEIETQKLISYTRETKPTYISTFCLSINYSTSMLSGSG